MTKGMNLDEDEDPLTKAIASAQSAGPHLVAVLSQQQDTVSVFQTHTAGVKLSVGLGALLKSVMPGLSREQKRTFLQEMLKEWRS